MATLLPGGWSFARDHRASKLDHCTREKVPFCRCSDVTAFHEVGMPEELAERLWHLSEGEVCC